MIIKKTFKLFTSIFIIALLCLYLLASNTAVAASSVYVDDINNVSSSELKSIIKENLDLPKIYYGTRINGGIYSKAELGSGSFSFTDGTEYTLQVENWKFSWENVGTLVFHQKKNVDFSMKDNQSINYYDGIPNTKSVVFNAVCNGASCTPSLTENDVTVYFMCNDSWVDIASKSAPRKFGSVDTEEIKLTNNRKSDNWDDIYKTSDSAPVKLNIKDMRIATHIEIKKEIPAIRIVSDYEDEIRKYAYAAIDDNSEAEGAVLNITVNNGKSFEAEGSYPVKIEYDGVEGRYLPSSLGSNGLFLVSFYGAEPNYTAKLDCVGNGTVTINRNGTDEAFSDNKMIKITDGSSNGFTINATPTKNSGYYTYSIVVKNGSRIVAENEKQNSLTVPNGLFESGDICTVFVTFCEAEVHFSRYITLHNKLKVSGGASKELCKQAIFDEAFISSTPENLTVNDVAMKMERDVFGFIDFDKGLNHFGTRDKETVKIYYTYNGVDINNVVYVSFSLTSSEIVVPSETIILNEGDNYNEELNKKLSVKIKDGDFIDGATLSFAELDEIKLNVEQTITASYAGVKDDIASSSAQVKVKILPQNYIDVKKVTFADSELGNKINFEVLNYLDAFDKTVIFVTYKEDKSISEVGLAGKTTFNYGTTTVSFDLKSKDFATCKLFIWDSLENIRPFFVKSFSISDIK